MKITPIRENAPAQGHPYLNIQYPIKNFTVTESIWGKFIVCRSSAYHPELMIKTGTTVHPAENETLATIISTLPENCVIVDAGANVGAFCVPMSIAAAKKKGTVYAFEVQKKLYQALCGTAVLNDFDNLEIYNVGLGAEDTSLKVPKLQYNQYQDFGIVSLLNQNITDYDLVNVTTVDSLKFERLDLVKIDVEGMELDILKGAVETVKTHRPYFWIEHWLSNTAELKQYFINIGDYSLYRITGADVLCVPNEKVKSSGMTIDCPYF